MSTTVTDPKAIVDSFSHVATTDAFRRMMDDRTGRNLVWKVWIRPAYVVKGVVTPCAPFIGEEGLNSEWRAVKGLRITGTMSGNQMHNAVRFKLCEVPLWATEFKPEHDNILEPA